MIKPLLALVFVFALASPSLAVVTNYIATPLQDTYYPSGNVGTCGIVANNTVPHGNDSNIYIGCLGDGGSWFGILEYNISQAVNKIILSASWNPDYTGGLTNWNGVLEGSNDTSWNESNVVPPLVSSGFVINPIVFTTNGFVPFNTTLNSSSQMGTFYALPELASFQTSGTTGSGFLSSISSKEGGNPAFWNFTLGDFQTVGNTANLLSGDKVYYDFDAQVSHNFNFPQADFVYDSFVNTITPINGVTMSLPTSEQDTSNTLGTTNCFSGQNYNTGSVGSVNFPPGNYMVACFNLSAQHSGRNFLGAIKVLNASTTLFDFFAAQYSPQFATLSTPTVVPNPMVANQDAIVSWTSTTPTTTILHYFYTLNGVVSPIAEITNSTMTISHSVTIPGGQILTNAVFSVSPSGVDQFNNFYNSPYFNFSAVSPTSVLAIQGVGIFTFNQFGFPVPAGVSLDGQPIVPTSSFTNTQNVSLFGVAFPASVVPVGVHNISATSFSPTGLTGVTTITVTGYPKYVTLSLRPHNSCMATSFFPTQDQCNLTMTLTNFSSVGATGKYCQFNPGECNQYNFTDGSCLLTAGQRTPSLSYVLYTCYDNFNPTGVNIGADGNQGYVVPVGTATQGQNQGTTAFSVLGFDSEQTLNFLAMLISLLVTIAVGLLTKDVGVTGIVFIGMTGIFTLITWLPWWFLLIEVVLTSFLVAKFFRGIFTPQ